MSMKKAAQEVRAQGRGKDTELVHLTKREVDALHGIAALAGGGLTVNPKTGMTEAGFLDSLLPTILGFGATMIGGPMAGAAVGAATGAATNKNDPLMGAVLGGLGGYGGGQFAQGLGSLGSSAVSPDMLLQASNAADPINALAQAKDFAAASGAQAPTGLGAIQAGFQNTTNNPMGLVNTMGGGMETAKAAGMAAAPLLYDSMMPKPGEPMKKPGDGERREFEYDPGYTGGIMTGADMSSERRWFDPTYTRTMAEGGEVAMESGGFVIPADVVSMAGGGSTDAGLGALAKTVGARPIKGPGSGQSDDIPATIDGKPIARVANGEAYVPKKTVQKLGGARKLYKAMDNIRTQAQGHSKQIRPVNLKKALA